MARPLDGLLVVALEQAVAAPMCTRRLADAGARVIKVERPEGDFARGYDAFAGGDSAYFVWLNRGKESIALDLARPQDAGLLRRIIARADVLVQNLKPGALARLGFPVEALRAADPRLICCSISGYGESGPMASRKAYDLLIQAEAGLASITGAPEAAGRVGVSIVDVATGLYAYEAVLEALIARGVSGRGAAIQVSMFDAVAELCAVPLLQYEASGQEPRRVGFGHPFIVPYGAFTTAEGRPLVIAVQNDREFAALCAGVLGQPGLAADPRFATNRARVENRAAIDGILAAAIAAQPFEAVAAKLAAADIAFASINGMAGLSGHPHLRRIRYAAPAGEVSLPAPPAAVDGEPPAFGPVPALDAQGAAIRREFAATP
ncbi:MAG: CaiB/BaiF CoA-transferase family protein [Thalassobaculales bacterium]